MANSSTEIKRKAVHIGSSAFGLLLRWLTWWQAAALALAALVFNVLILPRIGGRGLYRDADHKRGYPIGIVLYPISVLLCILLSYRRLYVAAAAWAIMAWGDGFASIIGQEFGTKKLPWNTNRSYAGSLAFLIIGSAAAVGFTIFTWPVPAEPLLWYAVAIPLLAAILATVIETIPTGLDDNLTVPLCAALFMLALHQIDPELWSARKDMLLHNLVWGAAINLALAGFSYAVNMVSLSGFVSGFLIGTTLYTFGGYPLFLTLFVFFFLGSGATKFGYARKKALGVAQEKGGARGWKNATANCTMGAFAAILAALTPEPYSTMFVAGVFGAFATAVSDTVSSEIGQVLGKHPILITTLRPVPVGTEGAVSIEGTLAGIVASAILCGVGVAFGTIGWWVAGLCIIAAFIGTTVESYLGATLEQMKVVDNEIINFMNTVVGAGSAMVLTAVLA